MSMVVEPLISGLVENAVSIATSFIGSKLKIGEIDHVLEEIKQWQITLKDLHGFLRYADDKKGSNPAVLSWVEDLEELTQDAEDLIEEFNYELLQRQLEPPEPSCGCSSYLEKLKPRFPTRRRTEDLSGKLKEIAGRLEGLKGRKSDLNLFMLPVPSSTELASNRYKRDPSGSLPTEPVIYGRDDDKLAIIRMLKQEGDPKIGVVPIVGMGGVGKTTLARYVYNDDEIKNHFDVRGWVCVSSDYDTRRITKDILESVSNDCDDIKDKALGWIQNKLGKKLRNKKFLLVLDDNWNDNYTDWNTLRSPFGEGSSGSKILVTTRSQNVADTVRTAPSIIPNLLSENDCWSLFCSHANLDPNGTSFFEKVGKEISKKCSGLPLAAMTVGGMLRNKVRVEEWEDTQNSMTKVSDNVMSVLRMSYNDLTSLLKLCFAFFAIFPEDYKFGENEVMLLWIGAGLIQSSINDKKTKREVALDCFHKLLSRSLFSPIEKTDEDNNQLYMMHDLVRQLAQQVSSRYQYIGKDDANISLESSYARHLSFNSSMLSNIVVDRKANVLPLRTLVLLSVSVSDVKLLDQLFSELTYIRVLSLCTWNISKLPASIGQMKLLRYLNLNNRDIRLLPKSVTLLYNLEILSLRFCIKLKQLPEDIEKLTCLWYLDITACLELKALPEGIKKLKRLEKLTHFIVDERLSVASLGNLNLVGSLHVCGLKDVASPEEATLARLSEKRLDELVLDWSESGSHDPMKMETQSIILEELQPHENLKVLKVENYNGHKFPCWLKGTFRCLTVLCLDGCRNCSTVFTPNNLVSLKELTLTYCEKMDVNLPSMPNLKRLCLYFCSYVGCTDTFYTVTLDHLSLGKLATSDLFREKVKLGCPKIREIAIWDSDCSLSDMIADNYDEDIKVEQLRVTGDSSIEHLPQWVGKAKSIKEIHVTQCPSLEKLLPDGDIPPSLTTIRIDDCEKLTSIFLQDPLPETAKSLEMIGIHRCPSLKVLLPAKDTWIRECILLESFHEDGLPHSITSLAIDKCPLLSQRLLDDDRLLRSKISPDAYVRVDGRTMDLNKSRRKKRIQCTPMEGTTLPR